MPLNLDDLTENLGRCKKQIAALEDYEKRKKDPTKRSQFRQGQISFKEYTQWCEVPLQEARIARDSGAFWLFVKPLEDKEVLPNKIKLHIPLKKWENNGIILANAINNLNSTTITAIKTITPLTTNEEITETLSVPGRMMHETPITVYLAASASPQDIANAILQINVQFEEISRLKTIESGDAAASDERLGFCSITIERTEDDNPDSYIEGNSPEGIALRQQLLENSPDIQAIKEHLAKQVSLMNMLDRQIAATEKETAGEHKGGFHFKKVYTRGQNLEAARALKEAICRNSSDFIKGEHLGPLTHGDLKPIFRDFQRQYPELLDEKAIKNSMNLG